MDKITVEAAGNKSQRDLKTILDNVLGLGERKNLLTADFALIGNIPEFDSIAVVSLITALEEHYGIAIEDDEISTETIEMLGSLSNLSPRN